MFHASAAALRRAMARRASSSSSSSSSGPCATVTNDTMRQMSSGAHHQQIVDRFDSHSLVKELQRASFTEGQSEAVVKVRGDACARAKARLNAKETSERVILTD